MANFKTAAALLAAIAAVPTNGFTSNAPAATRSTSSLYAADEVFQRSLLEAQLNGGGAPAPVNRDSEPATMAAVADTPAPAVDTMALQNNILRIAASTDRGQYAKSSQKDKVSNLVSELEANFARPTTIIESSLSSSTGTWELLYSNTQLFRSSPFFLAGRSTCKTPEQAAQYNWFCEMHRAALAISTIGVVRQVITTGGKITNEFEVKVGAIPFLSDFLPFAKYSGGLPFTIDGAIVSTADVTPTSSMEWELFMDTVEIKGSNIPILRNVLDSDNVSLKSRGLSKVLEDNVGAYEVPKPVLKTVYIDESMRIVKDEDENVFVYGRVSDSQEVTDYSGVMADLGVGSLLEEFNDAVTKIYL